MLLSDLRNYLREHQSCSLVELTLRFDTAADILRDMLGVLIRKQQVRQCLKTPACGVKCSQCNVLETELYEWVL
jgi:FeoC like transcriptional regulator